MAAEQKKAAAGRRKAGITLANDDGEGSIGRSLVSANEAVSFRIGCLGQQVGFLLHRSAQLSTSDVTLILAELDLSPSQYTTLAMVGDNPGLPQQALSRERGGVQSGVVPLLDSLEMRGLLKRVPQERDRRSNLLYITDKGINLLQQADELVHGYE